MYRLLKEADGSFCANVYRLYINQDTYELSYDFA